MENAYNSVDVSGIIGMPARESTVRGSGQRMCLFTVKVDDGTSRETVPFMAYENATEGYGSIASLPCGTQVRVRGRIHTYRDGSDTFRTSITAVSVEITAKAASSPCSF